MLVQGSPLPTTSEVQQMAAQWGLVPIGAAEEPDNLALWPENETPVMLFEAMLSQWRMGVAGPVGLDYSALPTVARLLRITPRALREAFAGLRVLEAETLAAIAERRG